MIYILRTFFTLLFLFACIEPAVAAPKPIIQIETNMGTIVVELNHQRAPATIANFLYYVKKKFYNGTIFHRVIPGFMIQGGGFDIDLRKKTTRDPIRNESTNGLYNSVGTIAMARTEDIDSATSQFYINVNDNISLNASYGKPGYTVFGAVIEGMDVVMKIAEVPVQPVIGLGENVPVNHVIINSITVESPSDKTSDKKQINKTMKEEK